MGTNQLSIDPKHTLLNSRTIAATTTVTSEFKNYDMFTTIGVQVNVSNASTLTASVKLQVSIDGVNFGDYAGSAVAITADGVTPYNISDFAFLALRVVVTVTVGSGTFEVISLGKQG